MDHDEKSLPLTPEPHSPVNQDNPEGFFTALAVLFVVTAAILFLLLNQTPQP